MKSDLSPTRKYFVTIVLQLVLGGTLLWTGSLTWSSVPGELATQEFVGSDLDSSIFGVGAVSLAVVIGVLATRTWGRRILGSLGAVISIVGIYSLIMLDTDALNSLWWVAIALCAGLLVTNLVIAVSSKKWPTLGGKYSRSAPAELDAWELLDAGVDPTVDSTPDPTDSHD
jgi:hypothetical protein|tara:strand:- start:1258 stop:1770 length:513 start_codon:yes stop_codon:yes gene_type:complete